MGESRSKAVVREILNVEDLALQSAIRLYENTFPIDEREPSESLCRRIERRVHWQGDDRRISHLLVCEMEGELVGMRVHEYYKEVGLGWLTYLAVSKAHRRAGIGARLFRCGIESCRLDALFCGEEFRGAVLEVERPVDAVSESDHSVREQRLEFFARQNVVKLTDSYVQPALEKGGNPVPLSLFLVGEPTATTMSDRFTIVSDFMTKMWGLDASDPYVVDALAGVV